MQWYVLRSKPNKEMTLWRELTGRGFECFYPQLMEQVGVSMFQWMPFSSGFIAFDGIPATVPDNLVQAIHKHVDQINAAGGKQLAGLQPGRS